MGYIRKFLVINNIAYNPIADLTFANNVKVHFVFLQNNCYA